MRIHAQGTPRRPSKPLVDTPVLSTLPPSPVASMPISTNPSATRQTIGRGRRSRFVRNRGEGY
jgi:hypothetical protein